MRTNDGKGLTEQSGRGRGFEPPRSCERQPLKQSRKLGTCGRARTVRTVLGRMQARSGPPPGDSIRTSLHTLFGATADTKEPQDWLAASCNYFAPNKRRTQQGPHRCGPAHFPDDVASTPSAAASGVHPCRRGRGRGASARLARGRGPRLDVIQREAFAAYSVHQSARLETDTSDRIGAGEAEEGAAGKVRFRRGRSGSREGRWRANRARYRAFSTSVPMKNSPAQADTGLSNDITTVVGPSKFVYMRGTGSRWPLVGRPEGVRGAPRPDSENPRRHRLVGAKKAQRGDASSGIACRSRIPRNPQSRWSHRWRRASRRAWCK